MAKILFIESSMTIGSKRGSISTHALNIFKEEYKKVNPNDEIIDLDLNKTPMAQKALTNATLATGEFWNKDDCDKYVDQLKSVDKVVLAAPMSNFNYTAVLKNYFDHILVARKTFQYKYNGRSTSEGLLKHLKVQIITSQGAPLGWYRFANHTFALEGTWEFVGAWVIDSILIDGTNSPENIKKSPAEMLVPFKEKIINAASKF